MYIYIFEDGLIQQHSEPPTKEDIRSMKNGLLTVLQSKSDVHEVTETGKLQDIPACELVPFGKRKKCHAPA
jgi:hypothetical protein